MAIGAVYSNTVRQTVAVAVTSLGAHQFSAHTSGRVPIPTAPLIVWRGSER